MAKKTEGNGVDQFMDSLEGPIKEISEALRTVVRENMPGATELMAHGVPGYSASQSSHDRVVYIYPHSNWVNLGFFFGSDLPDPQKLLTGDGIRMRHVKIRHKNEVTNPAISELIRKAWEKAPGDMERIRKKKRL